MPTGACGINCDVCRLHVMGVCSTCGSPQSEAGRAKREAQRNLMGMECPVLECASGKEVHHCMRDCNEFPCGTFKNSDYPFSENFLHMQERRRKDIHEYPENAETPATPEFWSRLEKMDTGLVCRSSGAESNGNGILTISSLGEKWNVDVKERKIFKVSGDFGGEWDRQVPFMILIYLTTTRGSELSGEMIAPRELVKGGDFFQGIYRLDTRELEKEFGRSGSEFLEVSKRLGGNRLENGDYGSRFFIFPKFMVDYLLWVEDEEFPARFYILVDSETMNHFPPDAVALTLNLLTGRMLFEKQKSPG